VDFFVARDLCIIWEFDADFSYIKLKVKLSATFYCIKRHKVGIFWVAQIIQRKNAPNFSM
jgi:hypothetical protein